MATVSFTLQQKILHHVILHAYEQKETGMMNGRTGIAATLYTVGRKMKNEALTDFADKLLDDTIEKMYKGMPLYFYNGLCGIGWCMDFLLYERYLSGNPSEICADIDKAVMQVNPERLDDGLAFGFKGLLHYVLADILVCEETPFDAEFLADVYHRATRSQGVTADNELKGLCREYRNFYEYNEWQYSFKIESLVSNALPQVTEQNYKQQNLSLYDGLCGSLIKWSISNESNSTDSCLQW